MARMMQPDSYTGLSRMKETPIQVPRSIRTLDIRGLTSMPPGKCVPIAAFGLLRHDRVRRTRLRLNFEMLETVELLMNAVYARAMVYLVPNLAFDRFNGIDQLNRSYMGQPETDGGAVVPFFETMSFDKATNKILTSMGKHAKQGTQTNTAYVEAYNAIYNFRVANRSPDIAKRTKLQTTLAKAFWRHTQFAHIVPDFDQASIDGEVPLNVVSGKLPVRGIGNLAAGTGSVPTTNTAVRESGQYPNVTNYPKSWKINPAAAGAADAEISMRVKQSDVAGQTGWVDIYAELAENGITVSLSNIELARKTQAFARLRKQYAGHDDEWIIDLLMNGIEVPEQHWREPMLLADQTTIFGASKRYSTTADDLTASVVNGGTFLDLSFGTPEVPMGGVVMVLVEITPEQLFERRLDPYLHTTQVASLPEFMNDTLDPEKVEVVENQFIDVDHATPTGVFGYAPLNYKWNGLGPMIGGKFYRPDVDAAFDEDRQRIWAVETANPTLSEDFYLCTNMHQKPFVVTTGDNFEVVTRGAVAIDGLTVFGPALIESGDEYSEVLSGVDQDRIDLPATLEADSSAAAEAAAE